MEAADSSAGNIFRDWSGHAVIPGYSLSRNRRARCPVSLLTMAERNLCVSAIILHTRESPGGGKFVSCLSEEQGLLECFLFGGSKSKLRSLVLPWHTGRLYLYTDAKKSLIKITDFDPNYLFGAVREHYDAIMLANWASELMITTHGLGGSGYPVMEELLSAIEQVVTAEKLDTAIVRQLRVLKVAFVLKVLHLSGNFYKTYACEHCTGTSSENSILYYSPYNVGFVCEACSDEQSLRVLHHDVDWVFNTADKSLMACIREPEILLRLEASILDMLAHILERPLRTQALL